MQVKRAGADALERFHRLFEGQGDRGLAGQVVDLFPTDFGQHLQYAAEVAKRHRLDAHLYRNAQPDQIVVPAGPRVARRAEHAVTAGEQELREIGAILSTYIVDQRCLHEFLQVWAITGEPTLRERPRLACL